MNMWISYFADFCVSVKSIPFSGSFYLPSSIHYNIVFIETRTYIQRLQQERDMYKETEDKKN